MGLTLPAPAKAFGVLLGGAALPCALFALGASLVGHPITAGKGEVALLVGLKLLAHPLAVWVLVTYAFALQPLWAKVAVIEAALPTAVNSSFWPSGTTCTWTGRPPWCSCLR